MPILWADLKGFICSSHFRSISHVPISPGYLFKSKVPVWSVWTGIRRSCWCSLQGYLGSVQTCCFSDYLYNLFVSFFLPLYLWNSSECNTAHSAKPIFFFLIHVSPKAPISSFLCSDLLLLPNHSYEAEENNNNKNCKTLVASTLGLTC